MNLREELSKIEHDQWMHWSKTLADELILIKENLKETGDIGSNIARIEARIENWKKNWKPYEDLDEPTKEFDREWADKSLNVINGKFCEVR